MPLKHWKSFCQRWPWPILEPTYWYFQPSFSILVTNSPQCSSNNNQCFQERAHCAFMVSQNRPPLTVLWAYLPTGCSHIIQCFWGVVLFLVSSFHWSEILLCLGFLQIFRYFSHIGDMLILMYMSGFVPAKYHLLVRQVVLLTFCFFLFSGAIYPIVYIKEFFPLLITLCPSFIISYFDTFIFQL